MKTMKKKLAIAVTVALLAFPLSTTLTMANTEIATLTTTASATTALQDAAAAVAAYEAGPITTLAEVATAEGLKEAADTAVAAVVDVDAKAAFGLRVTDRAAAITTAKTALTASVVDADGKIVIPSTQFSDFIDKLQLALAFDPARKGELNKRHALRKLAQAHKLMKDGNIEASKICFNEYKDKIAMAQEFLLKVEDPTSDTAKTLAKALANVESNNIQVLSDLVVKLPPQAAQKLALNVVRTMEKAVIKIQKEEAKVAPVVPADTEKKQLEKQAKTALTEFNKSVNVKDKITDQKAKVNQYTTEQKKSEINQKFENLSHLNFRTSDNNKDDRNKQGDRDKDTGGDNNSRDHK